MGDERLTACATRLPEIVNYRIEFLNSLGIARIPQHILSLKIGTPIILLRNINPTRMCSGTWLDVKKKLMLQVIEAANLNGKSKGDVLIPCLPALSTDMLFEFKRFQFHVRLAFSMTINKAQGQSLQVCRLNLKNPWIAYGKLYVCIFASRKSHKIIHFSAGRKKKKRRVYHSTSINNYLQDTQQNIYFFEWRGNARRALASFI